MLYFFSRLNCRVSTSVVHRLPKPRRRVRLPYPAPHRSKLCIACSDFLQNSERAHAAASPFRKKSRSVHLLGCKRPRTGSLSLPTFLRVCALRRWRFILYRLYKKKRQALACLFFLSRCLPTANRRSTQRRNPQRFLIHIFVSLRLSTFGDTVVLSH